MNIVERDRGRRMPCNLRPYHRDAPRHRINGMKLVPLCALLLATAALFTSCCANDDDIITAALDHSAGIHDSNLYPADCRQPQMFVPVTK